MIRYNKRKVYGAGKNFDCYDVFGMAVCILQEKKPDSTPRGESRHSEQFQAGEIVFVDLSTLHYVEKMAKDEPSTELKLHCHKQLLHNFRATPTVSTHAHKR